MMIAKLENPQSDCLKKDKTFEGVNAENSKDIIKTNFSYLKTVPNPLYFKGIRPLKSTKDMNAFESCLILRKSTISEQGENLKKRVKSNKSRVLAIQSEPKNTVFLNCLFVDKTSGEIVGAGLHETNSHTRSNHFKIKTMDLFAEAYSDLYRQRRVSIMFHTLTCADLNQRTWSDTIRKVKTAYSSLGVSVLGYTWVLEVGTKKDMVHYHLAIAIERTFFKSIPNVLKFEQWYGYRTEINFVKKNIRHYLAKYFAKHNAKVLDLETRRPLRCVGKSKTFELPKNTNLTIIE